MWRAGIFAPELGPGVTCAREPLGAPRTRTLPQIPAGPGYPPPAQDVTGSGTAAPSSPGARLPAQTCSQWPFPESKQPQGDFSRPHQPCRQAACWGLSMRHPPGCSGQAADPAGPGCSSGQSWRRTLATPSGAAGLETKVLLLFLYFVYVWVCPTCIRVLFKARKRTLLSRK